MTLELLTALGVTASAAVAAAFGLLRLSGAKWLERRFSERFEAFKHQQNQEVERLRFRINALMDDRASPRCRNLAKEAALRESMLRKGSSSLAARAPQSIAMA